MVGFLVCICSPLCTPGKSAIPYCVRLLCRHTLEKWPCHFVSSRAHISGVPVHTTKSTPIRWLISVLILSYLWTWKTLHLWPRILIVIILWPTVWTIADNAPLRKAITCCQNTFIMGHNHIQCNIECVTLLQTLHLSDSLIPILTKKHVYNQFN